MEKAYSDESYISQSIIDSYDVSKTAAKKVNISASTIVIKCVNKLFEIVINYGAQVLLE